MEQKYNIKSNENINSKKYKDSLYKYNGLDHHKINTDINLYHDNQRLQKKINIMNISSINSNNSLVPNSNNNNIYNSKIHSNHPITNSSISYKNTDMALRIKKLSNYNNNNDNKNNIKLNSLQNRKYNKGNLNKKIDIYPPNSQNKLNLNNYSGQIRLAKKKELIENKNLINKMISSKINNKFLTKEYSNAEENRYGYNSFSDYNESLSFLNNNTDSSKTENNRRKINHKNNSNINHIGNGKTNDGKSSLFNQFYKNNSLSLNNYLSNNNNNNNGKNKINEQNYYKIDTQIYHSPIDKIKKNANKKAMEIRNANYLKKESNILNNFNKSEINRCQNNSTKTKYSYNQKKGMEMNECQSQFLFNFNIDDSMNKLDFNKFASQTTKRHYLPDNDQNYIDEKIWNKSRNSKKRIKINIKTPKNGVTSQELFDLNYNIDQLSKVYNKLNDKYQIEKRFKKKHNKMDTLDNLNKNKNNKFMNKINNSNYFDTFNSGEVDNPKLSLIYSNKPYNDATYDQPKHKLNLHKFYNTHNNLNYKTLNRKKNRYTEYDLKALKDNILTDSAPNINNNLLNYNSSNLSNKNIYNIEDGMNIIESNMYSNKKLNSVSPMETINHIKLNKFKSFQFKGGGHGVGNSYNHSNFNLNLKDCNIKDYLNKNSSIILNKSNQNNKVNMYNNSYIENNKNNKGYLILKNININNQTKNKAVKLNSKGNEYNNNNYISPSFTKRRNFKCKSNIKIEENNYNENTNNFDKIENKELNFGNKEIFSPEKNQKSLTYNTIFNSDQKSNGGMVKYMANQLLEKNKIQKNINNKIKQNNNNKYINKNNLSHFKGKSTNYNTFYNINNKNNNNFIKDLNVGGNNNRLSSNESCNSEVDLFQSIRFIKKYSENNDFPINLDYFKNTYLNKKNLMNSINNHSHIDKDNKLKSIKVSTNINNKNNNKNTTNSNNDININNNIMHHNSKRTNNNNIKLNNKTNFNNNNNGNMNNINNMNNNDKQIDNKKYGGESVYLKPNYILTKSSSKRNKVQPKIKLEKNINCNQRNNDNKNMKELNSLSSKEFSTKTIANLINNNSSFYLYNSLSKNTLNFNKNKSRNKVSNNCGFIYKYCYYFLQQPNIKKCFFEKKIIIKNKNNNKKKRISNTKIKDNNQNCLTVSYNDVNYYKKNSDKINSLSNKTNDINSQYNDIIIESDLTDLEMHKASNNNKKESYNKIEDDDFENEDIKIYFSDMGDLGESKGAGGGSLYNSNNLYFPTTNGKEIDDIKEKSSKTYKRSITNSHNLENTKKGFRILRNIALKRGFKSYDEKPDNNNINKKTQKIFMGTNKLNNIFNNRKESMNKDILKGISKIENLFEKKHFNPDIKRVNTYKGKNIKFINNDDKDDSNLDKCISYNEELKPKIITYMKKLRNNLKNMNSKELESNKIKVSKINIENIIGLANNRVNKDISKLNKENKNKENEYDGACEENEIYEENENEVRNVKANRKNETIKKKYLIDFILSYKNKIYSLKENLLNKDIINHCVKLNSSYVEEFSDDDIEEKILLNKKEEYNDNKDGENNDTYNEEEDISLEEDEIKYLETLKEYQINNRIKYDIINLLNIITEENYYNIFNKIADIILYQKNDKNSCLMDKLNTNEDIIRNEHIFKEIIFYKATSETKFIHIYAELCNDLDNKIMNSYIDQRNTKNSKNKKLKYIINEECINLLYKYKDISKDIINKINEENDEYYLFKKNLIGYVSFVYELINKKVLKQQFGYNLLEQFFKKYKDNNLNEIIKNLYLESCLILIKKLGKIVIEKNNQKYIQNLHNYINNNLSKIIENNDNIPNHLRYKIINVIKKNENSWNDSLSDALIKEKKIVLKEESNDEEDKSSSNENKYDLVSNKSYKYSKNSKISAYKSKDENEMMIENDLINYISCFTKDNYKDSKSYNWEVIDNIININNIGIEYIIDEFIQICTNIINDERKLLAANNYIQYIIENYTNILSKKSVDIIQTEMTKTFLIVDDYVNNNSYMYKILGNLLFFLIENKLYHVKFMNKYLKLEYKTKINLAIVTKNCIISSGKFVKKYYNDFKQTKLFNNNEIFNKYINEPLKELFNFIK